MFNPIEIDEETKEEWSKIPLPSVNVVSEIQDDGSAILKAIDTIFKDEYVIDANKDEAAIYDTTVQIKVVKERRKNMKKIKDMDDLELEAICIKQDNCRQCPLMMNVFIEDDDTYDYHQNVVCYKKYAKKIKKIEDRTMEV